MTVEEQWRHPVEAELGGAPALFPLQVFVEPQEHAALIIRGGEKDRVITDRDGSGAVDALKFIGSPGEGVVESAGLEIDAEEPAERGIALAAPEDEEPLFALQGGDDGRGVAGVPLVFGAPDELAGVLVKGGDAHFVGGAEGDDHFSRPDERTGPMAEEIARPGELG